MDKRKIAPGAPGSAPTWTSSAKAGIGKAMSAASDIVFTIGHGIVNEVYYPREDLVCLKELGLIVTDGKDFFSEEKRDTKSQIRMIKEGVPAYHLTNNCVDEKYTIEKEIITDPVRNSLLQKIKFTPSKELDRPLQLFVFLCPHLHNRGSDNAGCFDNYKGVPMLFAYRKGLAIALACSVPWIKGSVGYIGTSDGYTDLQQHKNLQWEYEKAENGNIGLTAQIDLSTSHAFTLAVGFGTTMTEAGNRARASILSGFDRAKDGYINDWENWQYAVLEKRKNEIIIKDLKISASVLRMSEAKSFPGGVVASISIPWGNARGDDDLGGYHLVWPRDLVETAGGFLTLNANDDVLRIVNYLMSIQEADGKWWQNVWLAGHPYWEGIQMDQVALPLLLLDACFMKKIIDDRGMKTYWPMIKKAVGFLLVNGPATQQGRWEQQSGLGPYTLATEIAGLLAAANLAEANREKEIAEYCRETADYWNSQIETWTYVKESSLTKKVGVDGYYVWMNPFCEPIKQKSDEPISVGNVSENNAKTSVSDIVSVDALALVRFGLRDAKDQRILNTIKVIDKTLKVNTPYGPCWHRFTNDVYGEDDKGDPFISKNRKGKGRAWPLLTGERGHYEVAAGNTEEAKNLLRAMGAFSQNGFLPEQVWDSEDIPEKELYCGRPTGSAMPLTWAHAEYIKLCCSIKENKIVDMPVHAYERYVKQETFNSHVTWRMQWPSEVIPQGKILRIELESPAMVHWTDDDWNTQNNSNTKDTTLGLHYVDIKIHNQNAHTIEFTFYWKKAERWENKNFSVKVEQ